MELLQSRYLRHALWHTSVVIWAFCTEANARGCWCCCAGVAVPTLSEVAPGIRLHCCLEYLEMREGLAEGVPLFPLPGALGFSCGFVVSLHHHLLDFRNAFPPLAHYYIIFPESSPRTAWVYHSSIPA